MRYCLILVLLLTACSTTVPVKRRFPDADPVMMQPAPPLVTLPADTQDLDQLLNNSAENFGQYRALTHQLQMWQEWYQRQRELFESVN
jgi:hypothetical protein